MDDMKKPAFPNSTFKTQDEVFNFMDKEKVYGDTAKLYAMKKAEDRLAKSLEPKVKMNKPKSCIHGISMLMSCDECLVR